MKLTVIDREFTLKLDSYEDCKLLELAAEAYGHRKAELEVLARVYEVKRPGGPARMAA